MTRIYFKPQGCAVRNPRSRTWIKAGERMKRSDGMEAEDSMKKVAVGNWRKQLDSDAIDQIADGLEKMVLSWTTSFSASNTSQLIRPDSNSPIVTSALLVGGPALEEMIRGELIKTRRTPLTHGGGGQQSAEASFWYISPHATSGLTHHEEMQPADFTSSKHLSPDSEKLNMHAGQIMHGSFLTPAHQNDWPHIQSMDKDDEIGFDTTGARQWLRRWSNDCSTSINCLHPEKELLLAHETALGGERIRTLGECQNILTTPAAVGCLASAPLIEVNSERVSIDMHEKKVEELQIALLECAMEYEVKIVEMKMQMLHLKSEHRQKEGDNSHVKLGPESPLLGIHPARSCIQAIKTDGQRVECMRKQLSKLQREKLAFARELNHLKKRERRFDLQRRSLEDALGRVNTLQRELTKREQEIMDCQLQEKEVRAQLYEVQLALHKAQATQIEPRRLLSLLPALREWLQTIKKVPCDATLLEPCEKSSAPTRTHSIHSIVCSVTREIQALQKALSKLASKK